jgi:hypothetical protein
MVPENQKARPGLSVATAQKEGKRWRASPSRSSVTSGWGPNWHVSGCHMWTLIGISAAVLVASAIFVLGEEEPDREPDFSKRRARPF